MRSWCSSTAGYGVILVETVGVGQDEVGIVATAEVTVLVLVPGMGDSIQAIKAGIMEIADVFVINKADRVETSGTERDLRLLQEFGARADGWHQPVIKTVATSGEGIEALVDAIAQFRTFLDAGGDELRKRRANFLKQRALGQLRDQVQRLVFRDLDPDQLDALLANLARREADPYTSAGIYCWSRQTAGQLRKEHDLQLGDFNVSVISGGSFWLDGGAMFGVVPKPLWEKKAPADPANRIELGLNCLLIQTGKENILVDTGCGLKYSEKEFRIYGIDQTRSVLEGLKRRGLTPEDITLVANTHLHFDHCGGNTLLDAGEAVPTFPNATYVVGKTESDAARCANERTSASYFPWNWEPLQARGQLRVVPENHEVFPGFVLFILRATRPDTRACSSNPGARPSSTWPTCVPPPPMCLCPGSWDTTSTR